LGINFQYRSWDSSVVIATATGQIAGGSITRRGKRLFFAAPRTAMGPTQSPIQWVLEALSPGSKQLGLEADHSHPYIAEVKNGGAICLIPHVYMTWSLNN
jgi:hypothetical protein